MPILVIFGSSSTQLAVPHGFKCYNLGKLKSNTVLSCAYNIADVCMLPSTEDNLPNTIIEAQACGSPGSGFVTGGMPDIIAAPNLVRLSRSFDTTDLADKIIKVLQANPEEAAAAR